MPGFPNGSSPEVERALREMAAAPQPQVAMQIAQPINDGQTLAFLAAMLYQTGGQNNSAELLLDLATELFVGAVARVNSGLLAQAAARAVAETKDRIEKAALLNRDGQEIR